MKKLLGSSVLIAAVLLTGCATDAGTQDTAGFSGPYAAEFKKEYAQLKDEKLKGYLRDSKVSEAEFQAITEEFTSCLAARGVSFEGYDAYGGLGVQGDPSKVANSEVRNVVAECAKSSGEETVTRLYFMVKRDPAREITPQTGVDCLVRAGVVPSDFSVKDFQTGGLDKLYPPEFLYEPSGDEVRTKIMDCQNDPLHAYGGK